MPEPTARTALRDQIIERAAEWAYAYPISSNAICQTDDRAWRLARIWGEQIARIAVMPVVEAETAALRQRIEEVEDQRDQALAWQDTAERRLDHAERIADALEAERDQSRRERDEQTQRAEEAERALAQARDAIADERRGRLAAEAAVRRVRALHQPTKGVGYDCDEDDTPGSYGDIAQVCTSCGTADEYGVRWPCPTIAALDAEEPR